MKKWPFVSPPNVVAITTKQIVIGRMPVLYVALDAVDAEFQFLHELDPRVEDALVVGLGEMLKIDPSLAEIADLPEGWHATRESPRQPWKRSPTVTADEDNRSKT